MDWDVFAEGHLDAAHEVLTTLRPGIEAVAAGMAERLRAGGKVLACGNGGSAADAQHFAAEISRRPRNLISMSTRMRHISFLTAQSILPCWGWM